MDAHRIARWTTYLQEQGYRVGDVLGSGMDGTVLALGDDRVVKIWSARSAEDVARLRMFYDAVADGAPAVRTPVIHEVLVLDGQSASVETRLAGRPLRISMTDDEAAVGDAEVACLLEVLAALRGVTPAVAMAVLPVLPGEPAVLGEPSFEKSLADLVDRRVRRFQRPLAARLPDLDALVAAVRASLSEGEPAEPRLLHGDLIPANILVDDGLRPRAVLDFGFMSTIGDPGFDAAVTGSIYDMYGRRAAASEAVLTEAVVDRFGYAERRLWVHRAAYALATANCFSASGSDGHFDWCIAMLSRSVVRNAVAL